MNLIAKLFLKMHGWNLLDEKEKIKFLMIRKVILIYPHTSYWDFYFMILYRFAYPEELGDMYSLVKPQIFEKFGWLPLNLLGMVKSIRLEERNSGLVENLAKKFSNIPRYKILISPKGSMSKTPIRSGYYYLAKKLDVDILIAGLDYSSRSVRIAGSIYLEDFDEKIIREIFLNYFKKITPLYPNLEHSSFENKPNLRITPIKILSLIIIFFFCIYILVI